MSSMSSILTRSLDFDNDEEDIAFWGKYSILYGRILFILTR